MERAVISVRPASGRAGVSLFEVSVRDARGESRHAVTLEASLFERLGRTGETESDFVTRCFEFLLEREGKESILGNFDVSAIATYFPEFERNVGRLR